MTRGRRAPCDLMPHKSKIVLIFQKARQSMASTVRSRYGNASSRSLMISTLTSSFMQTNRNNISYITGRPAVVEILSNWAFETGGVEIQDTERLADSMTRDVAQEEHSYTPGIYQDISATDDMRRRSNLGATSLKSLQLDLRYTSVFTLLPLRSCSMRTRLVGSQGPSAWNTWSVKASMVQIDVMIQAIQCP